jgi:hypothetical protein
VADRSASSVLVDATIKAQLQKSNRKRATAPAKPAVECPRRLKT